VSNKQKLRKPTKEVRLERFREQERNRLVKDAAPPPLPKSGVMAGGVVDPHYLALVARAQAPLERGTYEQVVTDAKRYAARLNRTILVGDIESETDLPDEDGFTEFDPDEDGFKEFYMLEIELLCPHGNGTDTLVYVKEGGGEPFKEPQDGLWEHSETGTEAMLDCPCPGVT
jgi:hypothetical protein